MSHFSSGAEAGRLLFEGMRLGESSGGSSFSAHALPPHLQQQQQQQQRYLQPPHYGYVNGASAAVPPASPFGPDGARRIPKRQMSAGTYEEHTPSDAELKLQRVGALEHVPPVLARRPGVVPKMWTADEDASLQAAVDRHGEKNWRRIADDIPNRSHLQCLQRWKKALRPGLIKGHWSKEEDALLLRLIETAQQQQGGGVDNVNWATVAAQIDGRNAKQCRERWGLNLDPSINRGPWTPAEDRRLLQLANECSGRWALISKNMPGRTENSVKTRFHSLQRQIARTRGWTPSEDATLMAATLAVGRDWTKVVKQLPGRSRGQAKKRFAFLSQHRPDVLTQVQELEARFEAGLMVPPNPPPAPIAPIPAEVLHAGNSGFQRQPQYDAGSEPSGPPSPAPQRFAAPQYPHAFSTAANPLEPEQQQYYGGASNGHSGNVNAGTAYDSSASGWDVDGADLPIMLLPSVGSGSDDPYTSFSAPPQQYAYAQSQSQQTRVQPRLSNNGTGSKGLRAPQAYHSTFAAGLATVTAPPPPQQLQPDYGAALASGNGTGTGADNAVVGDEQDGARASGGNAPFHRTDSQRIIGELVYRSDGLEAAPPPQQQPFAQPQPQQPRHSAALKQKLDTMLGADAVADQSDWMPSTAEQRSQSHSHSQTQQRGQQSRQASGKSLRNYSSWGSATGGGPDFGLLFTEAGEGAAAPPPPELAAPATQAARRLQKASSSGMSIGFGAIGNLGHALSNYDSASMLQLL